MRILTVLPELLLSLLKISLHYYIYYAYYDQYLCIFNSVPFYSSEGEVPSFPRHFQTRVAHRMPFNWRKTNLSMMCDYYCKKTLGSDIGLLRHLV
jgi:hypothetical protein